MEIIGKTEYFNGFKNRTVLVGKCDCGVEFPLICDGPLFACSCPNCDTWYNAFGNKLRDPSEWEQDLLY